MGKKRTLLKKEVRLMEQLHRTHLKRADFTKILNPRLSRHILTYSHLYDSATIERAKADLKHLM